MAGVGDQYVNFMRLKYIPNEGPWHMGVLKVDFMIANQALLTEVGHIYQLKNLSYIIKFLKYYLFNLNS